MPNQQTLQQVERHIVRLSKTREKLLQQREVLNKGIRSLGERLQADQDKLMQLRLDQMGESVDWAVLLKESDSMVSYRALSKALEPLGLRNSGYFPDTGQRCISFSLYKKDDEHTKLVSASLKMLLPHLLPCKDGYVHIDFMEKTLSEYGGYDIYLQADLTGYVNKRTYGRDSIVVKGHLDDLLTYIQQNLYMSKRK